MDQKDLASENPFFPPSTSSLFLRFSSPCLLVSLGELSRGRKGSSFKPKTVLRVEVGEWKREPPWGFSLL